MLTLIACLLCPTLTVQCSCSLIIFQLKQEVCRNPNYEVIFKHLSASSAEAIVVQLPSHCLKTPDSNSPSLTVIAELWSRVYFSIICAELNVHFSEQ